jgi:toxin HigB-1
VIRSFADRFTEEVWRTGTTRGSPPSNVTKRKLAMLDAAAELLDLRNPPGNRLEKLRGDRQGQHSIRINDQYRICFVWRDHDAYEVEVADYHWKARLRSAWEELVSIARKGTPNWSVHPGEVLREEFLKPIGLSAYEAAKRLRVPAPRINDIVLERRGISADTAVRLSRLFRTTEQFWLNLQGAYEISRVKAARTKEFETIEPLAQVAGLPSRR